MYSPMKRGLKAISLFVPGLVAVAECNITSVHSDHDGAGFSGAAQDNLWQFGTQAYYSSTVEIEDLEIWNFATYCNQTSEQLQYEKLDSSSTGRSGVWFPGVHESGSSHAYKSSTQNASGSAW